MSKEIEKHDKRGNLIYYKTSSGCEYWYEWDKNGDIIYYKNPDGYEYWFNVYKNCSLVYLKNYVGAEFWYKIESFGEERIKITEQEFDRIKEKEFLSRESVSIFELMEL